MRDDLREEMASFGIADANKLLYSTDKTRVKGNGDAIGAYTFCDREGLIEKRNRVVLIAGLRVEKHIHLKLTCDDKLPSDVPCLLNCDVPYLLNWRSWVQIPNFSSYHFSSINSS